MKLGINNFRLYNKHRYRIFQDKHMGTFQDYYNTHTHKGFKNDEGVN